MAEAPRMSERYATPDEVAEQFHVARRQVLRLVREHEVPVLQVGRGQIRFDDKARIALQRAIFASAYGLTHDVIVEKSAEWSAVAAVYFLIREGRVVYVGQSINAFKRLDEHRKKKRFDGFYFVFCPVPLLREIEAHYIKLLEPEENFETKEKVARERAHAEFEARVRQIHEESERPDV